MASSEGSETPIQVGSIVRAPRTFTEKPKGRATIAMIQDDDDDNDQCVCLFWEPCIPQPLPNSNKFLIAPVLAAKPTTGDDETTLDRHKIEPLLDFENDNSSDCVLINHGQESNINLWKDRGDQLLRLGDPTSAIPYYEHALQLSSMICIGSSVVCSVLGYPKIAEVDCVENDSIDVVYVESGQEMTIPKSDILIAILQPDDNQLQSRILLNLARCLLQQSEIDTAHRSNYLKSAILSCTLVLSITSFHNPDEGPSCDSAQTALLLRVNAQIGLSKWPHAIADAKRLVKLGNPQGSKFLTRIEREKTNQAKQDKKLVKAVSRWVQKATSESVSDNKKNNNTNELDSKTGVASSEETNTPVSLPVHSNNRVRSDFCTNPILILVVLTAAFVIQKLTS